MRTLMVALCLLAQPCLAQRSYTVETTKSQRVIPPEYYQRTRGNILAPAPVTTDETGTRPTERGTINRTQAKPVFGPTELLEGKLVRWKGPNIAEIETMRPRSKWVTDSVMIEPGRSSGGGYYVAEKRTNIGHYETVDHPHKVTISGIAEGSADVGDRIRWKVRWSDKAKSKGILSMLPRHDPPPHPNPPTPPAR